MRDSGDAIEKVLAGLRNAEAPAGMERRILERLEGQVSVVEIRSGWRGFVPAWVTMPSKALIFGVALAGVVAAVFVVPAIRQPGHMPEQSNAGDLQRTAGRTAIAERSSHGSRVKLGMTAKTPEAGLVRAPDDDAIATEDDVARSEMQAASFPAPPMPLTAQERLLLRLAQKVDPVEMAMLDPKFQAMQDAKEKAEFQRFFGQTPVKIEDLAETSASKSTADQAAQPSATDQGVTVQASPDQASPATDQGVPAAQDLPIQKQAAPEQSSPDQPTTQQPIAGSRRTGEKE